MTKWEKLWLEYAYDMLRCNGAACLCEPYANNEIRWPGYMGETYRGVLFVGARHNAAGLRKTGLTSGPLSRYAKELRTWSALPRTDTSDNNLIKAMRSAYRHSYPIWAAPGTVWGIFDTIRAHMGITWDDTASVNLARCYAAEINTGEDDAHIRTHAKQWSLDKIVRKLQPTIVFLSKDNKDIRDELIVTGERSQRPLVVRYSNHGTGKRRNEGFAKDWVPRDASYWKTLLRPAQNKASNSGLSATV